MRAAYARERVLSSGSCCDNWRAKTSFHNWVADRFYQFHSSLYPRKLRSVETSWSIKRSLISPTRACIYTWFVMVAWGRYATNESGSDMKRATLLLRFLERSESESILYGMRVLSTKKECYRLLRPSHEYFKNIVARNTSLLTATTLISYIHLYYSLFPT